ncbi:MAG: glycoside hydrolase family 31 protein [Provencibacterium sp.]|jgi:alpha-glucosidase (family GH31 glycosyl hydrolase)|nr:glycoside hydrolase family 31 protein [Provencibacterium sp.]
MKLEKYTAWTRQQNELLLYGETWTLGLSFAAADILRLRFNQGGALLEDPDRMIVENIPSPLPFSVTEEPTGLRLETEGAVVLIRQRPLILSVYSPEGRLLVQTKPAFLGECDGKQTVLRFVLGEDEHIYGLGQDPMGNVDQHGHERRMWNEWGGLHVCANASNAFYWSSNGYGLLLNSGWPARFSVGKGTVSDPPPAHSIQRSKGPWEWDTHSGEGDPDDLSLLLEDGRMDALLILRKGEEAIRGYTELTGPAPMPPKWALGYMQSKNRYRSREEFLKLAQDYRERGIPCDVLVLDWLWFKQFGDMEWDGDNWQNPEEMLKILHDNGFHIMQAYHPFIYEDSLKVEEFRRKNFLMNTPAGTLPIFDHSNPEAREEWWRQTKKLVDQGIDAYWIDMGEPRDHPQGTTCCLGSREHVHNLYSIYWAKGLYEGHRRDLQSRLFSLSRTSCSGIQRYGAALWSNDIDSSFEVLKDQVPAGLGVCLSGLPYWCTDIGGFATDDRFSAELFIRWMEWGVFCPLFRTHGTRPDNEPWSFGEEAEETIVSYIRLRYRLMPYIYSCARAVTESGQPMMRALCLDFSDDETACSQRYEYLFGPSLLVAPVLDEKARSLKVYLPEGEWFDFWTEKRFTGRQWITVPAPLGQIPLFVRGGSLIPMTEPVQYQGEKPETALEIHAYGSSPSSFVLYEDDGVSYGYEKGQYVKTRLRVKEGALAAEVIEGDPSLIPDGRSYQLVLHTGKKASEPILSYDHNLSTDGTCRVYVTADTGLSETGFTYEMAAPDGWKLTDAPCYFRKTPLNKGEKTVRGVAVFCWEFAPIRSLLPLRNRAELTLRIRSGGAEQTLTHTFQWGSGCVNRVDVLSFLDDRNAADRAIMKKVEAGEDQPAYLRKESLSEDSSDDGELSSGGQGTGSGDRISWNRHVSYNCWGYIDLRPMASSSMKDGHGTGYARFTIRSDRERCCRVQFSAERSFALWVNGELVEEKEGILSPQISDSSFTLRPGLNHCLVRCSVDYPKQMSGREIGFSLRFLKEDGSEAEGLLFE